MDVTPSRSGFLDRFWSMPWQAKLIAFILLPIAIIFGGTLLLDQFNFSVGTRTGTMDKLSKKGIICWTVEGQLALRNFARSSELRANRDQIDNTFYFSVPDKEVQKQLEAVDPGSTITLEYKQKLFALDWPLPLLCVRRTQFEITGVRVGQVTPPDDLTVGRSPPRTP